jgi:hypothetical protein
MIQTSPKPRTRTRPRSPAPSRATLTRWLRTTTIIVVVALAIAGAGFAAPAAAQTATPTDGGGDGSSLGAGTLCNSTAGDFLAKAVWLLTFGGLAVGLVMWQYTNILRMFGQRKAEEAAQREAFVKSGMVKLIAIPVVALVAAQVFGIPVIQCVLADLPFL